MSVYVIRHAHAGNRSSWRGEDAERPLSSRGHLQAKLLGQLLGCDHISRVISSPARRCIQTVEPLAEARGVKVRTDKRLAEGASVREAYDLLVAHDHQVLCAHGDLIPALMDRLVERGLRATGPERCQKGSVWEIELERGKPVKARYRPPPPG
jgi:8-oxo-dGTP diphosphatase